MIIVCIWSKCDLDTVMYMTDNFFFNFLPAGRLKLSCKAGVFDFLDLRFFSILTAVTGVGVGGGLLNDILQLVISVHVCMRIR